MPTGSNCKSYSIEKPCRVFNVTLNQSSNTTCKYLNPLSDSNLEPCTKPETYDYFTGSALSYIMTFSFVGITFIIILVLNFLVSTLRVKEDKEAIDIMEGQLK